MCSIGVSSILTLQRRVRTPLLLGHACSAAACALLVPPDRVTTNTLGMPLPRACFALAVLGGYALGRAVGPWVEKWVDPRVVSFSVFGAMALVQGYEAWIALRDAEGG